MGKFISALFLGALAIGLSIFTGSRTLDLLAWMLPANQAIYQWLGLAAFEGGMYFWAFYFIMGAKGTPQRSISLLMAVLSLLGVAIATIADLTIDAGQQGKVAQLTAAQDQAVIIFLGVIIVLNVAAYLACHLLSVPNMRRMKEQEAEDLIYAAGLTAISALAPGIASAAAPHLAQEWGNRTWERIVPGVPHQTYISAAPQNSIDTHQAPAPVNKIVESQQPKKSWFSNPFANLFSKEKPELHIRAEQIRPDHTRYDSRPQSYPQVRELRHQQRQLKLARPAPTPQIVNVHGDPITSKSIDKVTVRPPLAKESETKANQAAASQTKSTPARGSSGKKQGTARGAIRGK